MARVMLAPRLLLMKRGAAMRFSVIGSVLLATVVTQGDASARQAWDAMIAAKGGRAALGMIRAFVVKKSEALSTFTAKDVAPQVRSVDVILPPDRLWSFTDYRPGSMGVQVNVFNGGMHRRWSASAVPGSVRQFDGLTPAGERPFLETIAQSQYLYFCETLEVKPIPQKVLQKGGFTVIEATWNNISLVYRLDPTTSLPLSLDTREERPNSRRPSSPLVLARHYEFERYEQIGGVQLPTRVRSEGEWAVLAFEINPAVKKEVFESAPSGVSSGDAWR